MSTTTYDFVEKSTKKKKKKKKIYIYIYIGTFWLKSSALSEVMVNRFCPKVFKWEKSLSFEKNIIWEVK